MFNLHAQADTAKEIQKLWIFSIIFIDKNWIFVFSGKTVSSYIVVQCTTV
jgi:hypothetical protein